MRTFSVFIASWETSWISASPAPLLPSQPRLYPGHLPPGQMHLVSSALLLGARLSAYLAFLWPCSSAHFQRQLCALRAHLSHAMAFEGHAAATQTPWLLPLSPRGQGQGSSNHTTSSCWALLRQEPVWGQDLPKFWCGREEAAPAHVLLKHLPARACSWLPRPLERAVMDLIAATVAAAAVSNGEEQTQAVPAAWDLRAAL